MNNVKFNKIPELKEKNKQSLAVNRVRAFENLKLGHQRNKKNFNKKRKEYNFKVGDLVYMNHGNSLNKNKLDKIRIGPFKIVQKLSM